MRSIFSACVLAVAATLTFGAQPALAGDDNETMQAVVLRVDAEDGTIVVREIGSNQKHTIRFADGEKVPASRIYTFTGLPRELPLERVEIGMRLSIRQTQSDLVARAH
jgi:hypothetical protein